MRNIRTTSYVYNNWNLKYIARRAENDSASSWLTVKHVSPMNVTAEQYILLRTLFLIITWSP